jgi:hypothetical protein
MPQSSPEPEDEGSNVFIIITGDPVEGFIFTGPFATHEAAERWAEGLQDWSTAFLQPPGQGKT